MPVPAENSVNSSEVPDSLRIRLTLNADPDLPIVPASVEEFFLLDSLAPFRAA